MDITVRLYIRHDLDLIGLKQNPNFNFNKYMKDAVIAWANEDNNFIIPMPVPAEEKIPLKSSVFHFRLNNKEHEYVIKRLKSIRYSYRNAFLKTIFRHYLQYTPLDVFDFYNSKYDLKGNSYARPNEETIRIRDILNKQIFDEVSDSENDSENKAIDSNNEEVSTHIDMNNTDKNDTSDIKEETVIKNPADNKTVENVNMTEVEKTVEKDLKEEVSNMIENPLPQTNNVLSNSDDNYNNNFDVQEETQNPSDNLPEDSDDDMGDFDLFGTIGKMM